eukprot:tig00001527_g9258.t1
MPLRASILSQPPPSEAVQPIRRPASAARFFGAPLRRRCAWHAAGASSPYSYSHPCASALEAPGSAVPAAAPGAQPADQAATLADLKSMSPEELERFVVEELGERPARARSLWRAMYREGPDGAPLPAEVGELRGYGPAFLAKLRARASLSPLALVEVAEAADGTRKAVYALRDGARIESVLIPDGPRTTVCVSSQVGCAMGCTFCLTATMGLLRNLTAGEIVEQVVQARRLVEPAGPPSPTCPPRPLPRCARPSPRPASPAPAGSVFMGMGEPLDNFAAVAAAAATLASPAGSPSPRAASASPPPASEVGARLAVSLNASNAEQRARLMPVTRRPGCSLPELREALAEYAAARGEPAFVEYVLIGGVNDADADAAAVADLLAAFPAKVNLIPWNAHGGGPAAEGGFRPPPRAASPPGAPPSPPAASSPRRAAP